MINPRYSALFEKLNDALEKLHSIKSDNPNIDLDCLNWFVEHVTKNYHIFKSKKSKEQLDTELNKKPRGHVYWVEFGINIGSEFSNPHYAVVVKESKYTSVVVPLTSKKADIPMWIQEDDAIIPIGNVSGFETNDTECCACISFIRSVSKRRLSSKVNGKFLKLKLNSRQMDKIDQVINNRFTSVPH